MGVNGILATASRRWSSLFEALMSVRRRWPDRISSTHPEVPVSAEEQADVERRRRERSPFADDAAYFEFLIQRAVSSAAVDAADQP